MKFETKNLLFFVACVIFSIFTLTLAKSYHKNVMSRNFNGKSIPPDMVEYYWQPERE